MAGHLSLSSYREFNKDFTLIKESIEKDLTTMPFQELCKYDHMWASETTLKGRKFCKWLYLDSDDYRCDKKNPNEDVYIYQPDDLDLSDDVKEGTLEVHWDSAKNKLIDIFLVL